MDLELKKLLDLFNLNIKKLNNIDYYPQLNEINFNFRTYKRLGAYFEKTKKIEISYNFFKVASDDEISIVIIHELCHNLDHLLNGKCSKTLKGHGTSWLEIVNNVNEKLNLNISRYSNFDISNIKKNKERKIHNYIVKCKHCNYEQSYTSKFNTYEQTRTQKCKQCNNKEWDFVAKGVFAFNFMEKKRIIIYDE